MLDIAAVTYILRARLTAGFGGRMVDDQLV